MSLVLPSVFDDRENQDFNCEYSNSVITTAIPSITNDFGSFLDIGWYGSGKSSDYYLLVLE
jgi:hypothetical protein